MCVFTNASSPFAGPQLPGLLAALFAGLGVALIGAFVVAGVANRSADTARGDRAISIVIWCGSIGAAIGAALPVVVWLLR